MANGLARLKTDMVLQHALGDARTHPRYLSQMRFRDALKTDQWRASTLIDPTARKASIRSLAGRRPSASLAGSQHPSTVWQAGAARAASLARSSTAKDLLAPLAAFDHLAAFDDHLGAKLDALDRKRGYVPSPPPDETTRRVAEEMRRHKIEREHREAWLQRGADAMARVHAAHQRNVAPSARSRRGASVRLLIPLDEQQRLADSAAPHGAHAEPSPQQSPPMSDTSRPLLSPRLPPLPVRPTVGQPRDALVAARPRRSFVVPRC